MNKEIVGILRAGGIPHEMYAAQYIEELQAKIEQLEAEIERLRGEPERVLGYIYQGLMGKPWDSDRGPLTANCLWAEIGKWLDQARAENERLRAQIVETEATAGKTVGRKEKEEVKEVSRMFDEKPYWCPFCGAEFDDPVDCAEHMMNCEPDAARARNLPNDIPDDVLTALDMLDG